MVTSWNSVFIPKKLSGKEEEAKMFRLLFALSFVFILSTFAVSKNQFVSGNFFVIKYQDISSLCGWINVLKYSCWTLHSLESYHVVRARSPFFFQGSKNGTQQSQCGKSVSKDSCSCRDGMNLSQLAEFDILPKWNLQFLDILCFLLH